MSPDYAPEVLRGWGRSTMSSSRVATVSDHDLVDHVKDADDRGVLVRGLGRSYGDAAQNGGGRVLRLASSSSDIRLDESAGTVTVGAGVSLDDLLRVIVPRGFFVPVTPGTRFVTVGGAVAADIHGKNHHLEGSFGNHVRRFSLVLADGSALECSREQNPDAFWTTIGGMGLTGVIRDVTFTLIRIETSRCRVDTVRCDDFDELIEHMSTGDDDVRYSVAWVDLLSSGRHFGRGVLWRGDHARRDELPVADRANALEYGPRQLVSVPPVIPGPGVVNALSSAVFNEAWFRKEPRRREGSIKSIPAYFHPLDAVGAWNRLYGRHGFVQYQFVIPFGRETELRRIVETIVASRLATPLVVLKRFGAGNDAPLSFPMPGWTLTVDLPAGAATLGSLTRSLDDVVIGAGGRHYLAKDALLGPDAIRAGYPRLAEWQRIRHRLDPQQTFRSDLARRLGLVE